MACKNKQNCVECWSVLWRSRLQFLSRPVAMPALVRSRRGIPELAEIIGGFKMKKSSATSTGTVKWYDKRKVFGFITPDDGSNDVFIHYNQLAGCSELEKGQEVEFMPVLGKKGREAVWARRAGSGALTRNDVPDLTQQRLGWVKSFNADGGYGFIVDKETGKDVFVHARSLGILAEFGVSKGDKVTFTCRQAKQGLEAMNVSLA